MYSKNGNATVTTTTCFPKPILNEIKHSFNTQRPLDKIHATEPKEIVQELKEKETTCKSEMCWLKYLPSNKRTTLRNRIFAPSKPKSWEKKPNEWLTNFDILKVMSQYEEIYPQFEFIGPTTIDFDSRPFSQPSKCVENKLCNFSLEKYLERNIQHIGIIFNLDDYDEDGSHWVAMFINIPQKFIFYFDSACNSTPDEIHVFVNRIHSQAKSLNMKFKYLENCPNQHQYQDTECGMYSMYFLITMLEKKRSWKEKIRLFKRKRVSDTEMKKKRDLYFAPVCSGL